MKKISALLVALLVVLTGCGKAVSIPDTVKAGKVDGQTYTNDALKLSYVLPDGWTVFDPDSTLDNQIQTIEATQGEAAAKQIQSHIESGEIGYLFMAMGEQTELGTSNMFVQVASEKALNGMKPLEYAAMLADQFEESYAALGAKATVQPAESKKINGHDVVMASVEVILDGEISGMVFDNVHVSQAYSLYTVNGAVVIAVFSAYDEAGMEEGIGILENVQFA